MNKSITTIAQPNFLAVREDVSEEDVYQLTKAIYENLPFLQGIHKATKDMALQKPSMVCLCHCTRGSALLQRSRYRDSASINGELMSTGMSERLFSVP